MKKKIKEKKKNKSQKKIFQTKNFSKAYSFSEDFKTIFLLLISMLYGNMFFELCDRIHNVILEYTIMDFSILLIQLVTYFRVVISHLLAVIKYHGNWKMRFYDFLFVFITAFFEYSLIKIKIFSPLLDMVILLPILIIVFCIFSIMGFYISLKRALEKQAVQAIVKQEKKLQSINIILIILILVLYMFSFIYKEYFIVINFASSIIIAIDLIIAIILSKSYFRIL